MNATLVRHGLRNAMLLQPADYNESMSTDPITKGKLQGLHAAFPDLLQSDTKAGTILSKHAYAGNITHKDLGNILGFPCADEYEYTLQHTDEPKTTIRIQVDLKPGGDEDSVEIVVYVCKDDRTYSDAVHFADKAEEILKADPMFGAIVESVRATKHVTMPTKYYIAKLLRNAEVTEDDERKIRNELWNLGLEHEAAYTFDLKHPVHRGILIGLLTVCENNPLEAFYPLQFRPEEPVVDTILTKWDSSLQTIFQTPVRGGKQTTRKRAKKLL
jgi:hypothetical protein